MECSSTQVWKHPRQAIAPHRSMAHYTVVEWLPLVTNAAIASKVFNSLEQFRIELPSWGFADTGTRFGKYLQAAAAVTIDEKIADAAQVHPLTGVCPTSRAACPMGFRERNRKRRPTCDEFARTPWRFAPVPSIPISFRTRNTSSAPSAIPIARFARRRWHTRARASRSRSVSNSRDVSACGSRTDRTIPGPPTSASARHWFEECLARCACAIFHPISGMLVEYKPFEPAFYHTDIADWGMAAHFARAAGPQAKVLVDTGHHYSSQNIEQIVAWLLSENLLGGFHFNDRRYADDDLTLGSIDPYQVFRIFHEIRFFEWETGARADIAYMIDQSHNLKGKIEAMIQTVTMAQELWAKAALVDHDRLTVAQAVSDIVRAETCLQDAFATDVRPANPRMARIEGSGRRSDAGVPRKRLPGTHHRRTRAAQSFERVHLRMIPNPALGVLFHWLGGLASASFYVPYRKVKLWSWETYWLAGGVFSWIIAPWTIAFFRTNDLMAVLGATSRHDLFWPFFFGLLWGVGGLTFGLTMRYLGLSLGMAIVLGLCAAFGTLMPPLFAGEFASKVLGTTSGRTILAGVAVCLIGIAVAGMAGIAKERAMTRRTERAVITEFNLRKGIAVATLSGVMSACFAYGLAAGDPIRALTLQHGTPELWQGLPVLVVVLVGGFTTNFVWSVYLNIRNHSGHEYLAPKAGNHACR